jgi:hypothetical protein
VPPNKMSQLGGRPNTETLVYSRGPTKYRTVDILIPCSSARQARGRGRDIIEIMSMLAIAREELCNVQFGSTRGCKAP